MQAIILAAGMGKRLGEYTQDNTKCMVAVNGIRLIDRALAALHKVNVSRVVLVIGYKGENVKKYVGSNYQGIPIEYVENPIYDKTNNIYSLFLAKDYLLSEDTLLLESDIIYDPSIIRKLVEDRNPNIALVDKFESWMDGTVVTIDEDNRIKRFVDKSSFNYNDIASYYKTVNIYKFSQTFSAKYYVPFLAAYSTALGNNEYYEQVLRVILHLHDAPLKALSLNGEPWYEIDDVQDLDIAQSMFSRTIDEKYSAIVSRYGGFWRYPHLVDFCYLVNPYFPPQRMVDELKSSFETLMREYPSGMRVNSLLASRYFGVKQEYIVVGNGAAELIKSLMENRNECVGVVEPTFEEYPNRCSNSELVVFQPKTPGFKYSVEDLIYFFGDHRVDSLLLINPDNPSGNFIPFNDLLRLVKWTGEKGIQLIVDESFVDFAAVEGKYSLFDNAILGENSHLVVVKSISKSYGIPGFRLGVLASGNTGLLADLKKMVPIWNINSFGEFYMQIYEKYQNEYRQACCQFKEERDSFLNELNKIPYLQVYSSQANFFLCKVISRFSSHELALKLLEKNLLIKDCSSKKAFHGESYIRIAVRDRADNQRLIEALSSL